MSSNKLDERSIPAIRLRQANVDLARRGLGILTGALKKESEIAGQDQAALLKSMKGLTGALWSKLRSYDEGLAQTQQLSLGSYQPPRGKPSRTKGGDPDSKR